MPDYQKGKIYKIWDSNFTKCYIGSTIEELSQRMAKHRTKYKLYLNNKYPYTTSFGLFKEFGLDDCKIELLELYPCNSRAELEAREGHYIRSEECVNRTHIGRTNKEYYWENIEYFKERGKAWREQNKEYKNTTDRKYREENKEAITAKLKEKKQCECGCWVSRRNFASHKKSPKHKELMEQIKE